MSVELLAREWLVYLTSFRTDWNLGSRPVRSSSYRDAIFGASAILNGEGARRLSRARLARPAGLSLFPPLTAGLGPPTANVSSASPLSRPHRGDIECRVQLFYTRSHTLSFAFDLQKRLNLIALILTLGATKWKEEVLVVGGSWVDLGVALGVQGDFGLRNRAVVG